MRLGLASRLAALGLALTALAACGRARQQAALAIDEARLDVADVRRLGSAGGAWVPTAESLLTQAEERQRVMDYAEARKKAEAATTAARLARRAAKPQGRTP